MSDEKLECGCKIDKYGYTVKLCPKHLKEIKDYLKEALKIKRKNRE